MKKPGQKIVVMKMYRISFLRSFILLAITVVLSLFMSSSCSRKHPSTQNVAKHIILKHFKYPQLELLKVRFGSNVITPASDNTMKALSDEGLIKYEQADTIDPFCAMFLTEKGEKYVVGDYDGEGFIHIRLAEKRFVEVTYTILSEDSKEVTVEYTWKYANLTPFGKYLKVKSGERTINDNELHTEKIEMFLNNGEWGIERMYEQ